MSAFDKVAEIVANLDFDEPGAHELLRRMGDWETKYHRSHVGCMKIPAFRKLWIALIEAALGAVVDPSEVPLCIAKQYFPPEVIAELEVQR